MGRGGKQRLQALQGKFKLRGCEELRHRYPTAWCGEIHYYLTNSLNTLQLLFRLIGYIRNAYIMPIWEYALTFSGILLYVEESLTI